MKKFIAHWQDGVLFVILVALMAGAGLFVAALPTGAIMILSSFTPWKEVINNHATSLFITFSSVFVPFIIGENVGSIETAMKKARL